MTNLVFQPTLTFADVLEQADVIVTDGTMWGRFRNGWMMAGVGITAMLVDPFTDQEIRSKMIDATDVGFIPNIDGDTIVILKGYDRLLPLKESK